MWVQALAGIVLLLVVFSLFRLAMGLRWAKITRERARAAEESKGRRVVAELPAGDELLLLLEDEASFQWGDRRVDKSALAGVRMLLNGGILGEYARPGVRLEAPAGREDGDGRERWEVVLYLREGTETIPCGSLREGVSREIARRAFAAVKEAAERIAPRATPAPGPRAEERSA